MDHYNNIEEFIETYLYFDEAPNKLSNGTEHHSIPHVHYFEEADDDLFNAHSPYGPCDPEVNYQSMETEYPLEDKVIHNEVNKQHLKNSELGIELEYFEDNLNCDYVEVKANQQLSCSECCFKCSDQNEIRYHQLHYHAHGTPAEKNIHLTQLPCPTTTPDQPAYSLHWYPSEAFNTYFNLSRTNCCTYTNQFPQILEGGPWKQQSGHSKLKKTTRLHNIP